MGQFCFLVILLCVFIPIYVDCFECTVVNSITSAGPLTQQDRRTGAVLMSGNVINDCVRATEAATSEGVTVEAAGICDDLQKLGKFSIDGWMTVVGIKVHNNPMIVLGTNRQVYAARQ